MLLSASLPSQHWMPNHPAPVMARAMAAMFEPRTPNERRANTGNGMPNFVPAWALRMIGTRTKMLPSVTVRIACHQENPTATRLAGSM